MLKKITLSLLVVFASISVSGQTHISPPKLVVNIVVGAMRGGDIDRYKQNFTQQGFLHLADEGLNFTNANYDFQQTITPVSLATLTTGALPSTHGVVGNYWWEYILGDRVDLTHDSQVTNLAYNIRDYGYSANNLLSPTLSEALIGENPQSQSVSIALEPSSAIIMGGKVGTPYWIDPQTCVWGSSSAFMGSLPGWVVSYNESEEITSKVSKKWVSRYNQDFYANSHHTKLKSRSGGKPYESDALPKARNRAEQQKITYEQLAYTPIGNSVIFDYARKAVDAMALGRDDNPDILNIYLDPSRNIAQRYGAKSLEVEDMYCCLDNEIAMFIKNITQKINPQDLIVVLTSDHGLSSATTDDLEPLGYFNSQQFVVLVNSLLKARYGDDDWVLGYNNRNLYLNHKLIFKYELNTAEVQNEVATFALQFRGVAHAMTATAMRNSYFGGGYGHKMQNSFYPRRSGDVVINFMPGWIEQTEGIRADAGSTYRYDSHVPLIIYAPERIQPRTINREVTMENIAPTIANILQIEPPAAADGKPLEEIFNTEATNLN